MFAVKQAIKFDNNAHCKGVYYQHILRETDGQIEVEPLFVVELNSKFGDYKLDEFMN